MFEGLKGLAGLAGLMKDLPRIKAALDQVRQTLEARKVEAEAGGGAVHVTANGLLRILSIEIDPVLLAGLVDVNRPEDRGMASDLIASAVNAALERARQTAQEELGAAARELGLPLPPGALEGLLT
jgi:hypothetical protein